MTKTFGDYIFLSLSILGSLFSIVAFGIYFVPSLNVQGLVGICFIGFITIYFIGYNLYLVSKYRHSTLENDINTRYTRIFDDLNIAFSYLHVNYRNNTPPTGEEIIRTLNSFCDSISAAFQKINICDVGVCIKFLTSENERAKAETIARDTRSINNGRQTGKADETKHWIDANSDFSFIYNKYVNKNFEALYFYEPNLPLKKDYKNTRLQDNWCSNLNGTLIESNKERIGRWHLKYRSTLVVPIIPLNANEQDLAKIRGFLCIDAPIEGAFSEHIDVCILRGISDGLYNQMDILNNIINKK